MSLEVISPARTGAERGHANGLPTACDGHPSPLGLASLAPSKAATGPQLASRSSCPGAQLLLPADQLRAQHHSTAMLCPRLNIKLSASEASCSNEPRVPITLHTAELFFPRVSRFPHLSSVSLISLTHGNGFSVGNTDTAGLGSCGVWCYSDTPGAALPVPLSLWAQAPSPKPSAHRNGFLPTARGSCAGEKPREELWGGREIS